MFLYIIFILVFINTIIINEFTYYYYNYLYLMLKMLFSSKSVRKSSNIVSMNCVWSDRHNSSINCLSSNGEAPFTWISYFFFTTRQRTSIDWVCAPVLGSIKFRLWFTVVRVNPCSLNVAYVLHWSLWIVVRCSTSLLNLGLPVDQLFW